MPVAAPADKRFRRARVSPGRRRTWRPSWRAVLKTGLIVAAAGFALSRAFDAVLSSEALQVTHISVQGNERVSRGEVLALLDGIQGQSLVTADLEHWRETLLTSPWVADAAIRRVLPGGVVVAISERRPMGIARIRGELLLVDGSGAIIDAYGPNYAEFDLPIIDGLDGGVPGAGAVDEVRARLLGRLMSDVDRQSRLVGQLSQIDVTDAHNAVVLLKGDTALVQVGEERFAERIESYLDLMPTLRAQVPEIDYVDLRFDERVYVGPQGTRGSN